MRPLFLTFLLLGHLAAAEIKPGVERWTIKTGGPTGSRSAAVAIADLLAFPNLPNVTKNDRRYQSERIPDAIGGNHREGQLLRTTGWLFLVAGEPDGDYHIQISGSAQSGDQCLVVEVPNPEPRFVSSADLRPQFDAVRTFIKTRMLAGKEPSPRGSVMARPPYVTVTGVLFYDDSHVGDAQPRGKKGMKAATLWELHPVTAIAFAPRPK